jgi:hypothetical protein
MIGQKRWAPQVDAGQPSSHEPNLSAAYMIRAMMASLKQLGVDGDPATIQVLVAGQLQQQGITSRKCFRCGSKDHVLANCPSVSSSNFSNGASNGAPPSTSAPLQQSSTDNSWKTVAPAAGTESTATLHHQGCKYVWCTTCAKWMYHKANKHDAWQARAAVSLLAYHFQPPPLPSHSWRTTSNRRPPNPVVSLAAVTPMDDDDWLSCGGRRFT